VADPNQNQTEEFTEGYSLDLVALEDLDPEVLEGIQSIETKVEEHQNPNPYSCEECEKLAKEKLKEAIKYSRDEFRDMKLCFVKERNKIEDLSQKLKERFESDSKRNQRDFRDMYKVNLYLLFCYFLIGAF